MPDWLRLALLRSMTETERGALREELMLTLEAFHAAQNKQDHHDLEIDILRKPGVRNRLLTSLGLGGAVVQGEGVFLRFLDGDELDELDQPMERIRPPLSVTRACLISAVGLIGLIAALFIPLQANVAIVVLGNRGLENLIRDALEPGLFLYISLIGYLLLSFILCIRNSQLSEFRAARYLTGRRARVSAWGLHIVSMACMCILYALLLTDGATRNESLIFIGIMLIQIAAAALHFRLDQNNAPLRSIPNPDGLRMGYLAGPLVFTVFAAAATSPLIGSILENGAIRDFEPRMFFALMLACVLMLTVVDLLLRPVKLGQRLIVTILDRLCISTLSLLSGLATAALGSILFVFIVVSVAGSEPLAASFFGFSIGAALLIALTFTTDLRFLGPVLAFAILYPATVIAFGPWGDDIALSPEYFLLTVPLVGISYLAIPAAHRRLKPGGPKNG